MDGVCDGFGDILRFIAFGLVLHKMFGNGKISSSGYQLMDIETNIISPQEEVKQASAGDT